MRKLFLLTALLFTLLNVKAQNELRGVVTNENNQLLAGATVTIKQISKSTVTNQKGEFKFSNLPNKSYNILVKYMGYESVEKSLYVNKNNIITLKSDAKALDEVIVSATRANDKSPVAYTNISKKELEEQNTGQDLPYLLATTPSFVATSDAGTGIGYTGFRIRGTDANRTNVTINGIPYNDPESQSVYFVDLPDFASSLNSVQIQRGVGTSSNGAAAFGASINLQTDVLRKQKYGEIDNSLGSFGTMKNTVKVGTGLINNFAIDARLSNLQSDGYIDRASVNMQSYFVSAGYFGEKTMVKFVTFGGKEKTYQAWNGVDLDKKYHSRTYNESGEYYENGDTLFYKNQIDNYNQYNYQLLFTQIINPDLTLNAALHYTRGYGYYEGYKQDQYYLEFGLTPAEVDGVTLNKTDLVRQKWLDNNFGGGVFSLEYNKNKLALVIGGGANKYSGDHYGKVIWVRYANNFDPDHQYYFNTTTKTDANIYAKANYDITEKLTAYADLQYRHILLEMTGQDESRYDETTGERSSIDQTHPFNFFNPKFGLNYKFDKYNAVFASFAIANREPNRNNYTDAINSEAPTYETLYDTELGYKLKHSNFNFGANLYYMNYKNQLILTGLVNDIYEPLTTNVPKSYRAGIELMGGVKIYKGFHWDGNLSLSQNKIEDFTEYVDEYDIDGNWTGTKENYFKSTDISYSPNIIANSIFGFDKNGFSASFTSSYVGKQYLDNTSDNDRAINAYFVNNLRIGYSWKVNPFKSIDFNLLINNLFNAEYETNGYNWYTYYIGNDRYNEKRYFPQAGTNFLFSVGIKL